MSKAAAGGGSPMFLGAALIVGALIYSRSQTARATTPQAGTGSMPGSAGTGNKQVVGGVVQGLLQGIAGIMKSGGTPSFSVWRPFDPTEGASYDPSNPAAVVPVQDLVNGTIHDYYAGDRSSWDIPTTGEIFDSVTGGGGDFMRVNGWY